MHSTTHFHIRDGGGRLGVFSHTHLVFGIWGRRPGEGAGLLVGVWAEVGVRVLRVDWCRDWRFWLPRDRLDFFRSRSLASVPSPSPGFGCGVGTVPGPWCAVVAFLRCFLLWLASG
ncbi:hypothetical protein AMECASPLE_026894 [Ameca splendens]|uniref:Uncharacterized protein n=1 Tax=Ameca splendens TaxID=208324 RepID=A0ABV0YS23_9TELE